MQLMLPLMESDRTVATLAAKTAADEVRRLEQQLSTQRVIPMAEPVATANLRSKTSRELWVADAELSQLLLKHRQFEFNGALEPMPEHQMRLRFYDIMSKSIGIDYRYISPCRCGFWGRPHGLGHYYHSEPTELPGATLAHYPRAGCLQEDIFNPVG